MMTLPQAERRAARLNDLQLDGFLDAWRRSEPIGMFGGHLYVLQWELALIGGPTDELADDPTHGLFVVPALVIFDQMHVGADATDGRLPEGEIDRYVDAIPEHLKPALPPVVVALFDDLRTKLLAYADADSDWPEPRTRENAN